MAPRRANFSYRDCGKHSTSKGFGDGMETGHGCHNQSATFSNILLRGRTAWVFSISSKKNLLLLSLLTSTQLYADRTIYSVLDKTILDQTAVSLAQMIKHELELDEDNEDALIKDSKSGSAPSLRPIISNFTSL